MFDGERFAALREAGCPVQRPLWASTGVKNPAYPETMYVYGLVARDCVNTMPLPTLTAAAREGEVSGETAADDPTTDLEDLSEAGIDLDDVTAKLLRDGIDAFVVPMNKLLDGIESKREAIVTGRPDAIEADLPAALEQAVAGRLRRAQDDDVVHRIWHRDGTLWAPEGTPEVADRLGWLDIAEKMLDCVDDLEGLAHEVRGAGYTDVVLCGMGGSSLAPEVFRRSWPNQTMKLHVLDSTHPDVVKATLDAIDLEKTLFVISSKSGGTIETRSQFRLFHERQSDGAHYVAVTDPGTSLAALGREHGFRRVFENDPEIGGRYSALSYFGLVPAALIGVDVGAVLETAEVAAANCQRKDDNSGLWLGIALGELARNGRDKLTFVVDEPLSSFGLWVEQLVAESTGKHGRGILPIADEPLVRSGRLRPGPRVPAHRGRRRGQRGEGGRAAQGRPPDDHGPRRGAGRPRAAVLPLRVRHRGLRLGARAQPVRPAQRAGGQGQHGQGAGRGRRRTSTRGASRRRSPGSRRPATWRSSATCPTARRRTRR